MCDKIVCLPPLLCDLVDVTSIIKPNLGTMYTSKITSTTTKMDEMKQTPQVSYDHEWILQFLREKHTKSTHISTDVIELPFNECKINNNKKSFNELCTCL